MIIESLHLKNFKSHRDTLIELNTGISIVIGGNGAGKSSILEAVSFALFKQHTSKRIEQLISIGQKRMSVSIQFTAHGRTYRVVRERTKTSSKAVISIKENGTFQSLASGDKQVTMEVQDILEMDGDLFLNAVYVRQGEIADLVEKTSAEKKQMIGRLLGIDSLEKAWKNIKIILDDYNHEQFRLDGKLESFKDYEEELNLKQKQKEEFNAEIKGLNRKIEEKIIDTKLVREKMDILNKRGMEFEKLKTLLNSKESNLERLSTVEREINTQLEEITSKEMEINELKPKLKKLEVLKSLDENLKELKSLTKDQERLISVLDDIRRFEKVLNDNETYYNDYSNLDTDLGNLHFAKEKFEGSKVLYQQYTERKLKIETKISESLDKINEVLKESNEILETDFESVEEFEKYLSTFKPELEGKIRKTTTYIHDIQKELSNLNSKNKDLQKPIKELELVKDLCPICKSSIDSVKREELIEDYQSEINVNVLRSNELKEKLLEIEAQKESLNSKQTRVEKINIGILNEYLKSIEEYTKEIENINSSLDDLEGKIGILENIEKDIKDKKSKKENIKGKYEVYLAAKGSLESLGNIEEHSSQLNEINGALRDLKKKISMLMEIAGDSVENLTEEINYLNQANIKYQRLLGEVKQKETLIKRHKENQTIIFDTTEEVTNISAQINELKYSEKSHQRVKDDWDLKNNELNQLTGKKQMLIGQSDQINLSIKELKTKIESFHKYKTDLKNLQDFIKLLNFIRDIYGKDGVQKDLRNVSRPLIEEKTRDLFEKFNFEYSDIKLDEDYDVTIYGPTGESSLDMISGGEKIAVALALRLGITQVLSGGSLEMIMLDEPTIHLDTYRRQELIDLLKKMSIIPQMIIVTHDGDLEDAADNILRIEKEEGNSFLAEF